MTRLERLVARATARLGLVGAAGLLLLLLAGVFWFGTVRPAQAERDRLAERAARLAERSRVAAALPAREPDSPERRMARFLAAFPDSAGAPATLLGLQAIAARHGLRLASGEYRFAPEPGTDLVRYQITLPVKAAYPAVRAFLDDALVAMPTLAIDALSLKRESAGAREVEGRVQLSLFVARP